jgi:glycerate 2-kinase
MPSILVAPNAFKGTLSALQAARAIERGVRRVLKEAEITVFPMSDGGGGFLDAMLATEGGARHRVRTVAPHGTRISAAWGTLADGKTAIVEMARSSGLRLVPEPERNPLFLSSFGTGKVLLGAFRKCPERIVVGLGDTATVDGGAGILQALGVRLLDSDGTELSPGNPELKRLEKVDVTNLHPVAAEFSKNGGKILLACDVDNPLLGPRGAAAVFGPQKGAKPEDIPVLEANLTKLADAVEAATGRRCRDLPGAGAAGGAGWALACLFDTTFVSGAELVLDSPDFRAALARADLVITGEGALDAQSLGGKGPVAIARTACAARVIAFAGRLALSESDIAAAGFTAAYAVPPHLPNRAAAALAAAVAGYLRRHA